MPDEDKDTFDPAKDQMNILGMFLLGRDITQDSFLQRIEPHRLYTVIWSESRQKWFVTKKISVQ